MRCDERESAADPLCAEVRVLIWATLSDRRVMVGRGMRAQPSSTTGTSGAVARNSEGALKTFGLGDFETDTPGTIGFRLSLFDSLGVALVSGLSSGEPDAGKQHVRICEVEAEWRSLANSCSSFSALSGAEGFRLDTLGFSLFRAKLSRHFLSPNCRLPMNG